MLDYLDVAMPEIEEKTSFFASPLFYGIVIGVVAVAIIGIIFTIKKNKEKRK